MAASATIIITAGPAFRLIMAATVISPHAVHMMPIVRHAPAPGNEIPTKAQGRHALTIAGLRPLGT